MAGTSREMRTLLVCYDIAAPKRLQQMARLMEGFGTRLQRSVFVCYLDRKQQLRLQERMASLIDAREDSVVILPLCASCVEHVEEIGLAAWPRLDAPCRIV